MRKVYISLEAMPLSVDVQVGGRLRSCDFHGGLKNPIIIMPKFSTDEEDLQKALEESASFNKSFTLIQEQKLPEIVTFQTGKDAKDWMNKQHNVPYNRMPTKESIVSVFLEFGLELHFANELNN